MRGRRGPSLQRPQHPFKITFTTASASEPAAAGARRRTDGSADPRVCPESRLVLLHRISGDERQCQTIDRGRRLASWSTSSADEPSSFGAVCTSAWVIHRSRNIGEAQSAPPLLPHRRVGVAQRRSSNSRPYSVCSTRLYCGDGMAMAANSRPLVWRGGFAVECPVLISTFQ